MDEQVKSAYRHLGLTGYAAIQSLSSNLKITVLNFGTAAHVNKSLNAINAISEWFGKLMEANVNDFEGFDESSFWKEHQLICESYKDYNLEAYRELFEDSIVYKDNNS